MDPKEQQELLERIQDTDEEGKYPLLFTLDFQEDMEEVFHNMAAEEDLRVNAMFLVFSGSLYMASGNGNPDSSESLKRDILERLHHRLVHILERQPLDIEGLQFACRQEFVLLSALGDIVDSLNPVVDPEPEGILIPEIEWEESGFTNEPHSGVNVPTLDIPLLDPEIMQLQENIDPLQESECFGVDIYLNTVRYVENLLEAR
ncbi:unnamed protein product [Boreogadus saida]